MKMTQIWTLSQGSNILMYNNGILIKNCNSYFRRDSEKSSKGQELAGLAKQLQDFTQRPSQRSP